MHVASVVNVTIMCSYVEYIVSFYEEPLFLPLMNAVTDLEPNKVEKKRVFLALLNSIADSTTGKLRLKKLLACDPTSSQFMSS